MAARCASHLAHSVWRVAYSFDYPLSANRCTLRAERAGGISATETILVVTATIMSRPKVKSVASNATSVFGNIHGWKTLSGARTN